MARCAFTVAPSSVHPSLILAGWPDSRTFVRRPRGSLGFERCVAGSREPMGFAANVQYARVRFGPNAEPAIIRHEANCHRRGIAAQPNDFGSKPTCSRPPNPTQTIGVTDRRATVSQWTHNAPLTERPHRHSRLDQCRHRQARSRRVNSAGTFPPTKWATVPASGAQRRNDWLRPPGQYTSPVTGTRGRMGRS